MIKTERAYKEAVEKLKQDREFIESEKLRFKDLGLTQEQIDLAIQPYMSFHEQLKEEVDYL